jgi:hypothetical protein
MGAVGQYFACPDRDDIAERCSAGYANRCKYKNLQTFFQVREASQCTKGMGEVARGDVRTDLLQRTRMDQLGGFEKIAVTHSKVALAALIAMPHPHWHGRPLLIVQRRLGQPAANRDRVMPLGATGRIRFARP